MVDNAREAAHRAASDAEQIAWVDEQDNLLGALVRSDLRERGLIGRGTYIMLFNSAGELCVHRRTLSKAIYPGFWDVAAGGMVLASETYAESAATRTCRRLPASRWVCAFAVSRRSRAKASWPCRACASMNWISASATTSIHGRNCCVAMIRALSRRACTAICSNPTAR